jgi:hypothetical protein
VGFHLLATILVVMSVTAMSHVCSHDLFIHNTRQIHCDVINVIIIICQITLLGHGYSSRLTCQSTH